METEEIDAPATDANDSVKETPTSQEQQEQPSGDATGAVPPDWTGFQAYSPMPPHGYLASSPQQPPYMWGVQHFMPPYVMYPHGGLYAHPSMPPGSYPFNAYAMPSVNGVTEAASVNTPGSMEVNGKSPEGMEKSKGSLGNLNMITGENNEAGKAGVSANGSYPKSGESGSEGSSDGSDANSENNSQMKSGSRHESMEGEASQNGHQNGGLVNQTMMIVPMSAMGPTTNLNMVPAVGSHENMQPHRWLQDERELKRQKRKQSNRESARRSRLRKQAECDELAQRAEALTEENASLKTEVSRIRTDYEQLLAENAALKERLVEVSGQEERTQETGTENHQNGQTELT